MHQAYTETNTVLIVFVDAVADDRTRATVKDANMGIGFNRLSRSELPLYLSLSVVLLLREN